MYITENQSIGESVLFMLSARSTLAEMVEDSTHESADVMVNFLMNEATDYEVINLLVTGLLPEEKYNHVAEALLFSVLKEQVLRDSQSLTEMVGQQTFSDFLTKVDTLYPHVSTAGPMIEFFANQDPTIAGAMLLSEALPGAAFKKVAYKTTHSPRPGGEGNPTGASSAKALKDTHADQPMYHPRGTEETPLLTKLGAQAKGALADIKAGINSAADAVSAFAKTPAGLAVGGAAVAALLAYGAAKTYKRFFSKAAGACRGMGGGAKTDCMNKYKGRAFMAQAADLQRGMASCGKSKNPAACKSAVGGKVERLKAKARTLAG